MPKTIEPLTVKGIQAKLKAWIPGEELYQFDGGGLYLLVKNNGSKVWNWKFRHNGKPGLMGFGSYPEVSLQRAREIRAEKKKLLRQGVNPVEQSRLLKESRSIENTFRHKALEWLDKIMAPASNPRHAAHIRSYLTNHVIPFIGDKQVTEVTADDLLRIAQRLEAQGVYDTCHRVIGVCSKIFCWALKKSQDPTLDMRHKLVPKPKAQHRAALQDETGRIPPGRVAHILRLCEAYQGGLIVRNAMKFLHYTAMRSKELREAEWKDIDFEAGKWHLLSSKKDKPHIVMLSRQAIDVLKEMQPITGHGRYVFPTPKTPDGSRPMSDGAILAAYRSLGIPKEELCGHGWRAIFQTLGLEELSFRRDLVELHITHQVNDPMGGAYHRAQFLPERKEMMQRWADYLDDLQGRR